MSNPLVSIIICCHNRKEYLALTLESVKAQNYSPVEIIVMDDGSTDGSGDLVKALCPTARYYWQESQGIAVARTNASRLARGEYIAYQDDDDLMPPERIVKLLEVLNRHPEAVLATGDYTLIDAQGRETGHRWLPLESAAQGSVQVIEDGQLAVLWPRVTAVPHTTLFRRTDGERINWFDHAFKYACSDADFLARLGRLGAVVHLREIVSYYRRGHAQIWADDVRSSISRIQLWTKHLETIGSDRIEFRKQVQNRLLNVVIGLDLHNRKGAIAAEYGWSQHRRAALQHLTGGQLLRFYWRAGCVNRLKILLRGRS